MEEKEIDLLQIIKDAWSIRVKVIKYALLGALVGVLIGFSIPKEYTTSIILAPESKSAKSSVSGISSMLGISSSIAGEDGVQSSLYPDVIRSLPFMAELFSIEVEYKGKKMSFYDYMLDEQKSPWWSYVIALPMKSIGWVVDLFKEKSDEDKSAQINTFSLSKDQTDIINNLRSRINPQFDQKKQILTVDITMQDAVISAVVSDSVVSKIKRYMYDYWTSKARENLSSTTKMFEEAKKNYYQADSIYAANVDRNRALSSESAKIKLERLANEKVLTFGVYQQTAANLESDRIKLQEQAPVITVIEPPTVPLRASSPKKMVIMVFFAFVGGFVGLVPVLYRSIKSTFVSPKENI